jgi:hypothetical protein
MLAVELSIVDFGMLTFNESVLPKGAVVGDKGIVG